MASYEERGDSIRAIVRLPGGKKETGTFPTRAEAERWAEQVERLKAIGKIKATDKSAPANEDLFDIFWKAAASKTDSADWNEQRLLALGKDPIARLKVFETTTHHVNEWIDRRLLKVSGSTVNRELNLMSSAFTYAVSSLKWITTNPCHGAQRPPENPPRNRELLTPDEIKALRIATGYDADPELRTKTARAGACFLFALETGMRSGEILRLRPKDYRKEQRAIHVAALEKGGRKSAKSGRATVDAARDVPLTARAIEILDQLLKNSPPDQPYIVGLNDDQRDALWRKAKKQACVRELTFHDAKHEAATRLSRFIDVLALSHAIGTKDIRLLRDTYYKSDAQRTAALLPPSLTH